MRIAILLIVAAGLNSTLGNLLLKQSRIASVGLPWHERLVSFYFLGAIGCYVVNLMLFAKALDDIPVSVAYPMLAASGFAMLAISSALVFGERFGWWQVAGLILVVLGIFALARS